MLSDCTQVTMPSLISKVNNYLANSHATQIIISDRIQMTIFRVNQKIKYNLVNSHSAQVTAIIYERLK